MFFFFIIYVANKGQINHLVPGYKVNKTITEGFAVLIRESMILIDNDHAINTHKPCMPSVTC